MDLRRRPALPEVRGVQSVPRIAGGMRDGNRTVAADGGRVLRSPSQRKVGKPDVRRLSAVLTERRPPAGDS